MALSDFAGGYARDFAKAVVKGAERYLRSGRRSEVFVASETLPEETFCPAEDEMCEEKESEEKEGEEKEDEDKGDKRTHKRGQLMMIHIRGWVTQPMKVWRGCYG